jgi:hypothetical protein
MVTVADKRYQQLGYLWGTTNSPLHSRAWMQFADDAALIAHDVKGAQALLDLSAAWCSWANMKIRTDKCCTFGMTKRDGHYIQIQPALYIDGNTIPPIELGGSFTYLGKAFNIDMDNEAAKAQLIKSVSHMMDVTDKLQVRTQTKLKIVKHFIPSQISFDLKLYDVSLTWINQQLDAIVVRHARNWLQLPISSCVAELMALPRNQGGYGIASLRDTAERLRLGQRFRLKHSRNNDIQHLWAATSPSSVNLDAILNGDSNYQSVSKKLCNAQAAAAATHIQTLSLQGA